MIENERALLARDRARLEAEIKAFKMATNDISIYQRVKKGWG
jgi:hypothetical protein